MKNNFPFHPLKSKMSQYVSFSRESSYTPSSQMVMQERHSHRLLIIFFILLPYQSASTLLASLVWAVKLGQGEWDYGHLWEKGATFHALKTIYSPQGNKVIFQPFTNRSQVTLPAEHPFRHVFCFSLLGRN